jgi:hypothetical protein
MPMKTQYHSEAGNTAFGNLGLTNQRQRAAKAELYVADVHGLADAVTS